MKWIDFKKQKPKNDSLCLIRSFHAGCLGYSHKTEEYLTTVFVNKKDGFYSYSIKGNQYFFESVTHWCYIKEPGFGV